MRPQPNALRPPEDPPLQVSGSSLDGYLLGRAEILRGMLDEIDGQVESRRGLMRELGKQQQEHVQEVREELLVLEGYPFSQDRWLDQRRAQLKARLDHLLQVEQGVKTRAWEDEARLTAERRGWRKEYEMLVQRGGMVAGTGAVSRGT